MSRSPHRDDPPGSAQTSPCSARSNEISTAARDAHKQRSPASQLERIRSETPAQCQCALTRPWLRPPEVIQFLICLGRTKYSDPACALIRNDHKARGGIMAQNQQKGKRIRLRLLFFLDRKI